MLEWKASFLTLLVSLAAFFGPLSDGSYNWNW